VGPVRRLLAAPPDKPVRIAFIRASCSRISSATHALSPFTGLSLADIGTGGGPRRADDPLGCTVTGIDAARRRRAARAHTEPGASQSTTAWPISRRGRRRRPLRHRPRAQITRHVADRDAFFAALGMLVTPGGFLSGDPQPHRALVLQASSGLTILGWLPRGTHDWRRFSVPRNSCSVCRAVGQRLAGLATTGAAAGADRRTSRSPHARAAR
jgi:2-polyprenyl-6-hydroxyphenyl methylase/3-demethylubiquinone-9 3-methyltransferase